MHPKPVALPRPPQAEVAATVATTAPGQNQQKIRDMLIRRENLVYDLGLLDAEIEQFAAETICGPSDEAQDVEMYDGTLGVTQDFVNQHERPVGQLQWVDDLSLRFNGLNDSPGNVSGVRWGSGALFANDLFITAGHCFHNEDNSGWRRPKRDGFRIKREEIATLMRVNFNFQLDGGTGLVRLGDPFPVVELLEYGPIRNLDYAIVRLGPNAAGKLPGEIYGTLRLASQDLQTSGAILCIIQHPLGLPKRIEAGPMLHNVAGQIAYDSLDTVGGASGSPVLSPSGEIAGIHTNGGCTTFSGFNYGVAIGAIRAASSIVS